MRELLLLVFTPTARRCLVDRRKQGTIGPGEKRSKARAQRPLPRLAAYEHLGAKPGWVSLEPKEGVAAQQQVSDASGGVQDADASLLFLLVSYSR